MPQSKSSIVFAIGALALSASDPKIVWAGTGEAWTIRDADVMGDGVSNRADLRQPLPPRAAVRQRGDRSPDSAA